MIDAYINGNKISLSKNGVYKGVNADSSNDTYKRVMRTISGKQVWSDWKKIY